MLIFLFQQTIELFRFKPPSCRELKCVSPVLSFLLGLYWVYSANACLRIYQKTWPGFRHRIWGCILLASPGCLSFSNDYCCPELHPLAPQAAENLPALYEVLAASHGDNYTPFKAKSWGKKKENKPHARSFLQLLASFRSCAIHSSGTQVVEFHGLAGVMVCLGEKAVGCQSGRNSVMFKVKLHTGHSHYPLSHIYCAEGFTGHYFICWKVFYLVDLNLQTMFT